MKNITHLHDPTTVFRHSCGTASLWTCSTSTVLPPIFSCPFLPTLPSSAVLRALRPNASLFFSVCYHWHLLFYYLFCLSYLTSSKMCTLVCMWRGVLKEMAISCSFLGSYLVDAKYLLHMAKLLFCGHIRCHLCKLLLTVHSILRANFVAAFCLF